MESEDAGIVLALMFVFAMGLVPGCYLGNTIGKETGRIEIREEAARLGKGEYYVDRDFAKQFRWLPQEVEDAK